MFKVCCCTTDSVGCMRHAESQLGYPSARVLCHPCSKCMVLPQATDDKSRTIDSAVCCSISLAKLYLELSSSAENVAGVNGFWRPRVFNFETVAVPTVPSPCNAPHSSSSSHGELRWCAAPSCGSGGEGGLHVSRVAVDPAARHARPSPCAHAPQRDACSSRTRTWRTPTR